MTLAASRWRNLTLQSTVIGGTAPEPVFNTDRIRSDPSKELPKKRWVEPVTAFLMAPAFAVVRIAILPL